ncbi:MAG TPA: hypothetical protein EYP92_08360, partial [Candidatus Thioglobus sp.]|nr:hypothetical protein [Candidatus Thioglobus sp.]
MKGYEYESIGTSYVDVKKGRDVLTETSFPINPNFGNSVKVTNFTAGNSLETLTGNPFNPETLSVTYDIHCVPLANIVSTNTHTYNSTKMGTTRIRQIDYSSGAFTNTSTSNTAVLDAYLFDTTLVPLTCNVGSAYTSGSVTIDLEDAKSSSANGAYAGVKITLGSETREITSYGVDDIALETVFGSGNIVLDSTDGIANEGDKITTETPAATINLAFGTSADTSNTVTINYSTREMESIAISNSTFGHANTPSMDIDVTSKVDTGTLTSNTKLFDTDTNSLVFKLGFDNIKGIGSQSGTTFTAQGISY